MGSEARGEGAWVGGTPWERHRPGLGDLGEGEAKTFFSLGKNYRGLSRPSPQVYFKCGPSGMEVKWCVITSYVTGFEPRAPLLFFFFFFSISSPSPWLHPFPVPVSLIMMWVLPGASFLLRKRGWRKGAQGRGGGEGEQQEEVQEGGGGRGKREGEGGGGRTRRERTWERKREEEEEGEHGTWREEGGGRRGGEQRDC